jgi:epithelial splicing regulatory protein 1/2
MQGVPYTAGMKDLLSVFQAYQVSLCSWRVSRPDELGSPCPKSVSLLQLAPDDYTTLMPVGDPSRTVLQAPKEWVCL